MLVIASTLLAGCKSTLQIQSYHPPANRLDPHGGVFIIVPPDAYDEPGSGMACATTFLEAFRPFADRIKLSDEVAILGVHLTNAAAQGFSYVLDTKIYRWEEEPTEWTGKPDSLDVGVRLLQAADGRTASETRFDGKSKWATFGGDHVADLLRPLAQDWVRAMYEGAEFREPTNGPPNTGQLPQQKTSLLSFNLLKDSSYEDAGTAKVIWAILVPSDVTRESLTNLLTDLYSQAQSKKFKQHPAATVIDIKAYMSRQHAESGMGQWVSWMSKSGGQSQPSLSLDERQINQLGKKAEEKFGLSEAKRKEIWEDTIHAEDRANKEAEQKYPEPSPQNRDAFMAAFEKRQKLSKELLNVYRDELAKKYSITRTQLTEITREGLQKSWAFPK